MGCYILFCKLKNSRMLSRTRSFSSSSCISVENLASHRRSDKKPSSGIEVRLLVTADSSSKIEPQKRVPTNDLGMDPERIKRLLTNRVCAERSRLRKVECIEEPQREIEEEEARLSMLSPLVSHYKTRYKLLEIKNCEMKEKVEAMENEKAAKEAEFQALLEEREALGQAYKLLQEGK